MRIGIGGAMVLSGAGFLVALMFYHTIFGMPPLEPIIPKTAQAGILLMVVGLIVGIVRNEP